MNNLNKIIYSLRKIAAIIDNVQSNKIDLIINRVLQRVNNGLLSETDVQRLTTNNQRIQDIILERIPQILENFLETTLNDLRRAGYTSDTFGNLLRRSILDQNVPGENYLTVNGVGNNLRIQANSAKIESSIIDLYVQKIIEAEGLNPGTADTLKQEGVYSKIAEELMDYIIEETLTLLQSTQPIATKIRGITQKIEEWLTERITKEVIKKETETEEGGEEIETEEGEEVSPYLPIRGPLWRVRPHDQY